MYYNNYYNYGNDYNYDYNHDNWGSYFDNYDDYLMLMAHLCAFISMILLKCCCLNQDNY